MNFDIQSTAIKGPVPEWDEVTHVFQTPPKRKSVSTPLVQFPFHRVGAPATFRPHSLRKVPESPGSRLPSEPRDALIPTMAHSAIYYGMAVPNGDATERSRPVNQSGRVKGAELGGGGALPLAGALGAHTLFSSPLGAESTALGALLFTGASYT